MPPRSVFQRSQFKVLKDGVLGRSEKGLISDLDSLQGGVRLDGIDGLVEATDFDVFVFYGFIILQGNLGTPHLPEDEIQVEKKYP